MTDRAMTDTDAAPTAAWTGTAVPDWRLPTARAAAPVSSGVPPVIVLPDVGGALDPIERDLDWALVARLQADVAERLAETERAQGSTLALTDRRELGRELIAETVGAWVDGQSQSGMGVAAAREDAIAEAIYRGMFGFGRLHRYLIDPQVEEVSCNGPGVVWVDYADGRRERGQPIASSPEQLTQLIQRLALGTVGEQETSSARGFSVTNPTVKMRVPIPGSPLGARITATGWLGQTGPYLSVRKWLVADPTLDDLLAWGSISEALHSFLSAAVRARCNILITGPMAAGKTTLLRACAAAIPPGERIATIETELELGLDTMGARHLDVVALETRRPTPDAPDSGIDEFRLVEQVLGHNARRVIVGEVRAEEIVALLDVMSNGCDGSMATVHTRTGHGAIERLLQLATRGGRVQLSEQNAALTIANSIDFIVHVTLVEEIAADGSTGRRVRFVDEVQEVSGYDGARPALNTVFEAGPDGRAVPASSRAFTRRDRLVAVGFDPSLLAGDGGWLVPADQIGTGRRRADANRAAGVPR